MQAREFNGSRVIIMTCSNCNVHCKHCYISYKGNFDGEQLYSICEALSERYWVQLNGTELLLHPEYFKTIALVKQNFILTNGLQFKVNPELINEIAQIGVKYVGMSYHFGIHESISSVSREIVEENIPKLSEVGIISDMRVTITRSNIELIPEMCKRTLELGAKRIKFTNYMVIGSAEALSKENVLRENDLKRFFEILESEREKYPEATLRIRRCGTFGDNCFGKKCNFKCPAGKDTVVMTPDFNIYPCIFLAKPGYEIGKMIDGKIMIYREIQNDGHKCLAKEVNNNGFKIF